MLFGNNKNSGEIFEMGIIGRNIIALRKRSGITQTQLAELMGISFQAVSSWERGQTLPDIAKLKELSRIFGVTVDALLDDNLAPEILEEMTAAPRETPDITKTRETETETECETANSEPVVSDAGEKLDIKEISRFLPHMSEESVYEICEKIISRDGFDMIDMFLPHMAEDHVALLADKYCRSENAGRVIKLLPFMDESHVAELAEKAYAESGDFSAYQPYLPFMCEDTVSRIAKASMAKQGIGAVSQFLPFLDEDDIDEIIKSKFDI